MRVETLSDGYWVNHTAIGLFNPDGITVTSFHRDEDNLLCFVNHTSCNNSAQYYSRLFGTDHMTRESFFSKLTEHPPLFEWVLFNLEIFESK